jgi:hypothetical protein
LKINSVLEHTDQNKNNWKQHVQKWTRVVFLDKRRKIPWKPCKRWGEKVTCHWGLIHVRKKKKKR